MGPLHRRRWGRAIETHVDGELPPGRTRAVLAHLADCPDCAGDEAFLRAVGASLRRLGRRRPADLAVARLRAEATRIG
jgi:anti-sigma factor RsiW